VGCGEALAGTMQQSGQARQLGRGRPQACRSGSPPTAEQSAEGARLMNRITLITQINGVLVIVTVALMAIGRYV